MDRIDPRELVKQHGSIFAVAREWGVSRQTVHAWLKAGAVPKDRVDLYRYRKLLAGLDRLPTGSTN